MKKIIDSLMNSAKKYTVFDFAVLKITLVFLGIILGAYFSKFFLSYILIIWVIFIVLYIIIMYKTFRKDK